MATEVVEIVIREKGAKGTSNAIQGVGRRSRTAAKAVLGLVTALGILAGIRGFAGVTSAAIDTSAAFEQYSIRLGALLGSQDEANKALETFVDLSSRTPFAVSQIVEGASTLAAAALGNRERLEELTLTAANLAAVTGLSFQEAAGNLQRSLQAGIGAADLFRERGVRALIESIGGIPDATKISLGELDAAFRETFGGGGVFGDAAENLSATLGGALSNIGDAATNAQAALGDALAGPVINAARGVLIPFLQDLQVLFVENEQAIAGFARDGLQVGIQLFGLFVEAGVGVLRILNRINQAGVAFQGILGEQQLSDAAASIRIISDNLVVARRRGDDALVDVLEQRLAAAETDLSRAQVLVDGLAGDYRTAAEDADAFSASLDGISQRAQQLTSGGFQLGADRPEVPGAAALPATDAVAVDIEAQAEALGDVEAITQRLVLAEAQRVEPLDAALIKLRQQEAALIAAATASGDLTSSAEGLAIITADIERVEAQRTTEQERQVALQAEIVRLVGEAAILAPELSTSIQEAADAAVAAGGGLEQVNDALADIASDAKKDLTDAQKSIGTLTASLGESLERGLGGAIRGAIEGEGFDAAQLFADVAADALDSALSDVLGGLGDLFGDLIGSAFGGAGAGGPISIGGAATSGIGAGVQAGLTAGLAILPGAIRDTTASVRNDLVRSTAVESAEATRGIIAGPTSIPIFQIGAAIEGAFEGTESLLAQILEAVQTGNALTATDDDAGGADGSAAGSVLSTQSPLLT